MKPNSPFVTRIITGLGSALIAVSAASVIASPGYVQDSAGTVITGDFGECVQTSAWSQDISTPECDAALAARLEAERLAAEKLAAEKARLAAKLAALESPAAAAPPILVRLSDKRNVMFEFNSANLTPAATQDLDRMLGKIREFDQIDGIEIVGHTDSSGPENYNQTLSEQRAASVKQFLESHGVGAALLSARGAGESSPVVENTTRDGRARNRRVDILISGNSAE